MKIFGAFKVRKSVKRLSKQNKPRSTGTGVFSSAGFEYPQWLIDKIKAITAETKRDSELGRIPHLSSKQLIDAIENDTVNEWGYYSV